MADVALDQGMPPQPSTGKGVRPEPVPAGNNSALKYITLALPVGYTAIFFALPLIFLIALGFFKIERFQVVPAFSFENYVDVAHHIFGGSRYGLAIAQSLYVSATTAIVAVLLCYPMVLAIVYAVPDRLQRLVLLLAVAPFWTSYILRVFAWQTLLARRGIINSASESLGLGFSQSILNTQIATRVGLIHYLAPILIIILYVSVSNIDRSLIGAARNLGATRWQVFRKVILPLSRVGIVLALCFATIISFGDVLSGTLLGGGAGASLLGKYPLFSSMIMSDYASSTNLPRTSVLAVILVLIMVVILVVGLKATDKAQKSIS